MNRTIKNVVMVTIILITCVLSFFTMKGSVKSSFQKNSEFKNEFGGKLPNFNNGEFSEENMPQRPSGNFEKGEMPKLENLPDNFGRGEIPKLENLPENFANGEMPENFNNSNFDRTKFKQNISAIYYILFAIEGLIISSLLIYLVMSNFNSKTLKETFGTSKKIIVFIILVLIITLGLTVVQSVVAKKVFATNSMTQFENRQRPNNNMNNSNNITNKDETNAVV